MSLTALRLPLLTGVFGILLAEFEIGTRPASTKRRFLATHSASCSALFFLPMQAPRLGTVFYLITFFPNSLFELYFALLLAGVLLLGI